MLRSKHPVEFGPPGRPTTCPGASPATPRPAHAAGRWWISALLERGHARVPRSPAPQNTRRLTSLLGLCPGADPRDRSGNGLPPNMDDWLGPQDVSAVLPLCMPDKDMDSSAGNGKLARSWTCTSDRGVRPVPDCPCQSWPPHAAALAAARAQTGLQDEPACRPCPAASAGLLCPASTAALALDARGTGVMLHDAKSLLELECHKCLHHGFPAAAGIVVESAGVWAPSGEGVVGAGPWPRPNPNVRVLLLPDSPSASA